MAQEEKEGILPLKVFIAPSFRGPDQGDGGIRRIVEAQIQWLPEYDIEVVKDIKHADLVATHASVQAEIEVRKPWVVHTHGLYWAEYNWPRWCHDVNRDVVKAMRKADIVTAPSKWVARAINRGMWIDAKVLYHGINPEDWEPKYSEDYILWNKTRIDPVCDPDPIEILAKMAPEMRFVTTFGADLPNIIRTGKLPFDEAKQLIKSAGVYLCTTRETFGIGTLEAMAAGIPIVGWDWAGQHEIIEQGQTGRLVPPGDYEALMEAIKWALANRDEIGAKARKIALERFTWRDIMKNYADLYADMVQLKKTHNRKPKVSVVIPCYNLGRFLYNAVESIVQQSMTNWEIIIVDDASTDDSGAIADELESNHQRITVIHNAENQYLAGALNTGIQAAKGQYIINVDADNMIAPDVLQRFAEALDESREFDIIYGGCKFVLEDGVTPDMTVAPDGVSDWPVDFQYANQIRQRNQLPSTSMFRREVWERTGGYRTRWLTAEDADFWTRATTLGFKPKFMGRKTTLIYRQRDDSMSRQHPVPDYSLWFAHSQDISKTPFSVDAAPPSHINGGISWHVPSYEPIRIAVIIPVGPGHERYLMDAIDSVYAQTFTNWECIVINDTGKTLLNLPAWVKVVEAGEGSGPAVARNIGLATTDAPLFVPLDADDYLQSSALDKLFNAWMIFRGVIYSQWWDDHSGVQTIYDPPEWSASLLLDKGLIHAVTALYPRDAWVQLGGFDPNLTHWEDWDFHIRLALAGICATKLPEPLFTYRKHTGFRRESNVADFEEGKRLITEKYPTLWQGTGREQFIMACRGCPGGGGGNYPKPPTGPAGAASSSQVFQARDGYEVLEFMGEQIGTQTFSAPSGTRYRFGNNPGHKIKYVLQQDVEQLMALHEGGRPKFRKIGAGVPIVPSSQPTMVAPSSSVREPVAQDLAPEPEAEPDPDTIQEIESVQAVGTVSELRKQIPQLSVNDLESLLLREKTGQNRPTAINLIQAALNKRKELETAAP